MINGEYRRGQLEKSVGLHYERYNYRICNDFGNMQATQFIDDLQNVVTEYMKTSHLVGISDLIANKKTQDSIVHAITTQTRGAAHY